jgi:hypothetical protein
MHPRLISEMSALDQGFPDQESPDQESQPESVYTGVAGIGRPA